MLSGKNGYPYSNLSKTEDLVFFGLLFWGFCFWGFLQAFKPSRNGCCPWTTSSYSISSSGSTTLPRSWCTRSRAIHMRATLVFSPTQKLHCYWAGSLDFLTFREIKVFSTKPSVVQWHQLLFLLFFGGCPKMVFPKKSSLFFQRH